MQLYKDCPDCKGRGLVGGKCNEPSTCILGGNCETICGGCNAEGKVKVGYAEIVAEIARRGKRAERRARAIRTIIDE